MKQHNITECNVTVYNANLYNANVYCLRVYYVTVYNVMHVSVCVHGCTYVCVPGRIQGLGCVPLHPWVRPCRSPPSHRILEKEKRLMEDVIISA
jgi:hypothetical protein